jgi:hypothetical protein
MRLRNAADVRQVADISVHFRHHVLVREIWAGVVNGFLNLGGQPIVIGGRFMGLAQHLGAVVAGTPHRLTRIRVPFAGVESTLGNADIQCDARDTPGLADRTKLFKSHGLHVRSLCSAVRA